MTEKQWNKILKDLHWDSPSYGWSIEKTILKRALKYERTELENYWKDKLSNICRDKYNNLTLDPSEIEEAIINLIIKESK